MKNLLAVVLSIGALVTITAASVMFAPTTQAESAALSIVPKKNYTVEAGKSINDTLMIRNLDQERPLILSLRVIDFSYTDDSGAPKLMLDENAPQTTWSLKPFMEVPKTVTIEPGSSQTVDMKVTIPAGHGAGSYYSAIVYSSTSSEGGNVGLSASGVTLVFTNIPGEVKENLVLEKLGAYKQSASASSGSYAYFHGDMPQRIAYTLKNEGNVTESPVGSITLKPLFGKERTIQNINPTGALALIGQTRTFTTCIKLKSENVDFGGDRTEATTCADPGLWPGYYGVSMAAYYGQNGNQTKDIVGKAGFWYLPWWFVLAVIAVLAFVGYHVWKIVRHVKKGRGSKVSIKKKSSRRR